jgi:hypothetical protein
MVDLLNSHPQVTCYGALFLPRRESMPPAGAQDRTRFSTYITERYPGPPRHKVPVLAWRFLEELYLADGASAAIGFKYMYSHFRPHPWVLAYARMKGIRVIHLVRRNKLEHLLSKDSAVARGQYHARPGDPLSTPPIHLDPERLVDRLSREEKKVRWARGILSLLRLPSIEVYYEDLVSDRTAFADVLRFLAVDPRTDLLHSDLQRWSRGTHEERIANYAAVRAALEGTRFSQLLS